MKLEEAFQRSLNSASSFCSWDEVTFLRPAYTDLIRVREEAQFFFFFFLSKDSWNTMHDFPHVKVLSATAHLSGSKLPSPGLHMSGCPLQLPWVSHLGPSVDSFLAAHLPSVSVAIIISHENQTWLETRCHLSGETTSPRLLHWKA